MFKKYNPSKVVLIKPDYAQFKETFRTCHFNPKLILTLTITILVFSECHAFIKIHSLEDI